MADPLLGDQPSGAARYQSGQAFSGRANFDFNNDAESTTDRPTVNGQHFERNSFRQPRFFSLDVRVGKSFRLGPGDLSAFLECFNCTDTNNHSIPSANQTWGRGRGAAGRVRPGDHAGDTPDDSGRGALRLLSSRTP